MSDDTCHHCGQPLHTDWINTQIPGQAEPHLLPGKTRRTTKGCQTPDKTTPTHTRQTG